MAVKIKLKRLGKIRAPYYRIVVADSRTKRDGRAIEEIGKYHPKSEPSLIEVDSERAQHWLSVGAQPTDPVRKILEITGDWQRFKGLPGESTLRTAEPRADRKVAFAAAVAENLVGTEAKPKTTRAKSEPKASAKTDTKADAKTDTKADAKTDTKADAKSDGKADAKSDSKADAKSDSKAEKAPARARARKADEPGDAGAAEASAAEASAADAGAAEASAAETPAADAGVADAGAAEAAAEESTPAESAGDGAAEADGGA